MKYDPRLILVSRSKVRAGLLTQAGYRFVHAEPLFDDSRDPAPVGPVTYADMPMRGVEPENEFAGRCRTLAQVKARSLALAGHPRISQGPHTILLAAHTALSLAKGAGDATTNQEPPPRLFEIEACRRFLEALADGFTVRVVTSVCFLQPDSGSNDCFDDKTIGVFGPAMPGVIEAYLATGEWAGLPGGLAIRRLMDFWPGSFSEDPTTGYGLPMQKTANGLKRWSIAPMGTRV